MNGINRMGFDLTAENTEIAKGGRRGVEWTGWDIRIWWNRLTYFEADEMKLWLARR
jgi:hypothetical protein